MFEHSFRCLVMGGVFSTLACGSAPRDEKTAEARLAVVPVAGFLEADIGNPPPSAGSSIYSNGTLTVTGYGDGVQRTDQDPPDRMHFVYLTVMGDVEIEARFFVGNNPAANSHVGLAMRTALGPSDDQAAAVLGWLGCQSCDPDGDEFYTITRRNGQRFQVASTTKLHPNSSPTAIWLRMQRVGNDFSVARRADNSAVWVPLEKASGGAFTASGTFNAGLLVGGRTSGATVTFDNVYIGPPRRAQRTTWIGSSYDRASTGYIGEYLGTLGLLSDGRVLKHSISEAGGGITVFDPATGAPLPAPHFQRTLVPEAAFAGAGSNAYFGVASGSNTCIELRQQPALAAGIDNCANPPLGTIGGMAARANPPRLYVTQPLGNAANPNPNVTILDGQSLVILGSFNVDPRPGPIAVDRFGEIWVVHTVTQYPNAGNQDPLFGASPSIKSYNPQGVATGRQLGVFTNPSAIAFNAARDELLVADNGVAQNIRTYQLTSQPPPASPSYVRSIGETFGVYASPSGPNSGLIKPTPTGLPRFYNLVGVAGDANGVYVASSVGDGLDVAKIYNSIGSVAWRNFGLLNHQNLADFDPVTGPTGLDNVYTARQQFTFDATASQPGSEWAYRAVTWTPFPLGPTERDERGRNARRSGFPIVRQIGSQRFLYVFGLEPDVDEDEDGPHGETQHITIYRFDNALAVPCGSITVEEPCKNVGCDIDPNHPGKLDIVGVLKLWVDRNGNRWEDSDEVTKTLDPFDVLPCIDGSTCPVREDSGDRVPGTTALPVRTFDVDSAGNIWLAFGYGAREWAFSTGSGLWQFRLNGLVNGVPNYRQSADGLGSMNRWFYPMPAEMTEMRNFRYHARNTSDPSSDVMYILGYVPAPTVPPPANPLNPPTYTLGAYTGFESTGSTSLASMASPVNLQKRFVRNLPDPRNIDGSENELLFQYIKEDCVTVVCGNCSEPGCNAATCTKLSCGYKTGDPFDYRGLAIAGGAPGASVDKVFVIDRFGSIRAHETSDGALTTTLLPGPEVSGYKGGLDIVDSIRAMKRADGEYLVTAAHTGGTASNIVFRWKPATCATSVGCSPEDACRGNWRADSVSGTALVDATGLNTNGTLAGGALWGPGFEGPGLLLPFGSAYAYVPSSATTQITGAITLAAWVKPVATNRLQVVIKKAGGYELGIESNGRPFVRFNQATSGDSLRLNALNAIPAGQWTHLAATSDRSVARLYVNGIEVGSVNGAVGKLDLRAANQGSNLDIGVAPGALGIGARCAGATGCTADATTIFRGTVDEIRLFARALPPEQITLLARRDPVGKWTWTNSTTVAEDSSGACNSGWIQSPVGTGPTTTTGALLLDGISQRYAQVHSRRDSYPLSGFTIVAWLARSGVMNGTVVSKTLSGVDGFELRTTNSRAEVRISRASAPTFVLTGSEPIAFNGGWARVAVTYDGHYVRLYDNTLSVPSMAVPGVRLDNSLPLTFGANPSGNDRLRGNLGPVYLYRRALDQNELPTTP